MSRRRSGGVVVRGMTKLLFNVAQLLRETVGTRRDYDFTESHLPLDDQLTLRDVAGHVRFTRTTSGVVVHLTARGIVELICVRSLEPFDHPLTLDVADEIHARVDVTTGVSLPKPLDEDPFFLSDSHMADIGEIIREYAILALPINPIAEAYRNHPVRYSVASDGIDDEPSDEAIDARLAVLKQWENGNPTQ